MLEEIMHPNSLFYVGMIAGLLQLLGYILYLSIKKIDPNPMTWLMFSYGTVILTVLEWDKDATFAELILPSICSVLGLAVFFKCWLQARRKSVTEGNARWWPKDLHPNDSFEKISFGSDLFITVGYITSWMLAATSLVATETREAAVVLFLVLSNLSVIIEFLPITKSTYKNPEKEHALPWIVWAAAYAVLGYVTWSTHGLWTSLMLYPALNAVTHLLVGVLALDRNKTRVA
jgi:hypothetical protein